MQRIAENGKIVLWISAVCIVSSVCYVPEMLRQLGCVIPGPLLYAKYGFVLTPALVTMVFLSSEHGLKSYLTGGFRRISSKEAAPCAVAALVGGFITCCYSFATKRDLFGETYGSIGFFAARCAYLFATAVAEETAWRGFLLQRAASSRDRWAGAAIFTGVIWGFWHMPMWVVRNRLGFTEIVPLFIWTVLVSVVLGAVYSTFENLLSVSLLHMICNVCFLAPVEYNVLAVLLGMVAYCAVKGYKRA